MVGRANLNIRLAICVLVLAMAGNFTTVRGQALCDYPPDGAVIPGAEYGGNIYTWLDYIQGPTALTFTGYCSENYNDVLTRAQDANLGPPPYPTMPTKYYVGLSLVEPFTDSLVRGTKYHWTVDETDDQGQIWSGDIWEFTIQDYYAFAPSPPNEAAFVPTDALLIWLPGHGPPPGWPPVTTLEHDVYMGTDWDAVNDANTSTLGIYKGYRSEPNYPCSGLAVDTKHFWRIDEVWGRTDGGVYYKGEVWEFTTGAAQIFVDIDAIGINDGSSWADAYNYLQDALSDAAVSGKDICIWVAEGTYKPDANSSNPSGTGDRAATFQLINGVILKGGYAGFGQPDPNARDCDLYETTLSGDINTPGDANDNCYHVVTSRACDLNTVLEGFTITGGNANGTNPEDRGAGMYNNNTSPTVTNCAFSGNSATSQGGGMYNGDGGTPTVSDCNFSDNTADVGGGMANYNNSSPTLTNCTFRDNSARAAGGMNNHAASSPTLTNCIFIGNIANQDTGGMHNHSGSNAILTNCVFANNSAENTGGGMQNAYSTAKLTNCTFSGNTAGSDGGGMRDRGGSNSTVTNCIFWGNTPDEIYVYESSPTVTYSDVQGGDWPGPGNIRADPCFMDASNPDPNLWNFRLAPGSPCIDAGDNTAVPASVLKDLAGKLRYADDPCTPDTGNAGMTGRPVVDMGAYEFQGCGAIPQNLLANPGFEVGDATGWVTNWGWNLTADTNEVHDGTYSGLASSRTASWQGAWQSLLGLMDDGKTYRISGWVRLQNATSDYVALTVKKTDSAGTNYYGIDNATGYDDQWVHLEGGLALDVIGQPTELFVYFEGPAPDVNFYVDDAAVTEVMGDLNHNGCVDFIDFSIFASYYGFDCSTQDCGRANLNDCDNTINELDLLIFCNNWLIGTEP